MKTKTNEPAPIVPGPAGQTPLLAAQFELLDPQSEVEQTRANFLPEGSSGVADAILEKHPKVFDALHAFSSATANYVGAFRLVLAALRDAAIVGKELQAVLARAGWAASRISEAKRLVECRDDVWKRFLESEFGVHAALKEARAALPAGGANPSAVHAASKALTAYFVKMVNGYSDTLPKKRVEMKTERLDCVFILTIKPKKKGGK